MIPESAVEAAARVTFEGLFDLDPDDGWEYLTPAEREPYERQARAALEAAAPHMLAEPQSHVADQILAANNTEGFAGLSAGLVAALKNLADRIPE